MAVASLSKTLCILLVVSAACSPLVRPAAGWSNGGYSVSALDPEYGTHDWLAQHALDHLPPEEKAYLLENLDLYLYGTELPDNSNVIDGIGDSYNHHVYYDGRRQVIDDVGAERAQEEYNHALYYLERGRPRVAAKYAGIVTHYVSDLAVFGHVMGSGTEWGREEHHGDYEQTVRYQTVRYESERWDPYLAFDGRLERKSPYMGALEMAELTTFGDGRRMMPCTWMDDNYDFSDPVFRDSTGASLNYAVNIIADILHTLAEDAGYDWNDTAASIEDASSASEAETDAAENGTLPVVSAPAGGEEIPPAAGDVSEATTDTETASAPHLSLLPSDGEMVEVGVVDAGSPVTETLMRWLILLIPLGTLVALFLLRSRAGGGRG